MRLEYTEQAQEVLAVMEETAHQMKFSYIVPSICSMVC